MPYYVIRQHDHDLREEVEQARTGNRLVVLIGDASSGKTRALWEAIQALEGWRVWRPADHHALMHGLAESRSLASTVLWLNESQRFLHTTNTADGERAAAALTGLLTDPGRGPVLMVGTLWRKQAHSLMSRHDEEHQQARALLAGGRAITVAESFSDADLEELRLRAPEDARLAEALKHGAARITQYLAGAPELLLLNDRATAEGRAVLDAAADARRLGHSAALFPDFLKAAAAANLQPDLWRSETKEWRTKWFEGAIAYTSQSSRGLPGPLTLELPPPGHVPYEDDAYLLADYLHQHLAKLRCYAVPPPGFWDAAATHISDADDLMALSKAASDRWRLRIARQILLRASDAGHPIAMRQHGILKRQEGDDTTARRLFQQAGDAGDAEALWQMSWLLEDVGKAAAAKTYHDRAAQASNLAELSDRVELRRALEAREDEPQSPPDLDQALALWRSGDLEDAERLLQRTAAAGWKESWRMLADRVAATGDDGGTERLLRRAVDEGDSWALNNLSRMREEKGDLKGAERAFWQAIDAGDVVARDTLIWMKQRSERLSADPQRFRRAIALGNLTYFMGWQPEDNKDYGEEWEQVLEYGLEADGSVSPPWQ
ncbi:hypothetical protein PV410_24690 [Streptomyces sp. PA03-5A]|nr:hypothetical protein [Streptomyces sp. PA03-5A]